MSTILMPDECIMLIDDNEMDNWISSQIIKRLKLNNNILSFTKVTEALHYIESFRMNKKITGVPKVIFLDLNFPQDDGFDFLKQIHSGTTDFSPLIYILSASVNSQDMNEVKKYPFVKDFLAKPLTMESVSKVLIP